MLSDASYRWVRNVFGTEGDTDAAVYAQIINGDALAPCAAAWTCTGSVSPIDGCRKIAGISPESL